jgi:hypothetical protein
MSDTARSAGPDHRIVQQTAQQNAHQLVQRLVDGIAAALGPAVTGGGLGGELLALTVTLVADEGPAVEVWSGHIADPARTDPPEGNYAVARAKTALTLRTGLTAEEVHKVQPELLVPGDVEWWGNTVLDIGGVRVVVSASGLAEGWDQRVCEALADLLAISLGDDPKVLLAAL